jgi:DNA polymerase-1
MYDNFRCRNCELGKTSSHILPENPSSKLLAIVLSNPSLDQQKSGSYLNSKTWFTIKTWLANAGIDTKDVHFTGLLRCYVNREESPNLETYVQACKKYLDAELDIVKPKLVLLLGKIAYEAYGGKDFSKNAGSPFNLDGRMYMASYSPAHVAAKSEVRDLTIVLEKHYRRVKSLLGTDSINQYDYGVIKNIQEFNELIEHLDNEESWVFDTEGTSLDHLRNKVIGIGFTWRRYQARYLPLRTYIPILGLENYWSSDEQQYIIEQLRRVAGNDKRKGAQNAKFDIKGLYYDLGILIENLAVDSMLLLSVLKPAQKQYSLDAMSESYADLAGYKQEVTGKDFEKMPLDKLTLYNNRDTDLTYRIIADNIDLLFENKKLTTLFTELLMPLSDLTTRIEYNGIRIDTKRAKELHLELWKELQEMDAEIVAAVGKRINIKSSHQLADALYNILKLPQLPQTQTKGGKPGTGKEVLLRLLEKTQHPVLRKIMKFKSLSANKGVFVDSFIKIIERKDNKHKDYILDKDGYFHANYKLAWTSTGRLSSGKEEGMEEGNFVNMQNIPRDKRFRNLFLPDENHLLLEADHAQLELRVLAHVCQDRNLFLAFERDYDPHCYVASAMLGLEYEEVYEGYNKSVKKYIDARNLSKNIGFGWIYLAKDGRFALYFPGNDMKEKARAEKEAKIRYFDKFNRIAPWRISVINEAREKNSATTISGRLINVDSNINSETEKFRVHAERQVVNNHIQGPASDLTALNGVRLDSWIRENGIDARIINFVHDAIYTSCNQDKEILTLVYKKKKEIMETPEFGITSKMKAEIKITERWGGKDLTSEYINS